MSFYFASGKFECPGAMFTASHNPAKYNGIKLCRAFARPVGQETGLGQIKDLLVDGIPASTVTRAPSTNRMYWLTTPHSCMVWSTSAPTVA